MQEMAMMQCYIMAINNFRFTVPFKRSLVLLNPLLKTLENHSQMPVKQAW